MLLFLGRGIFEVGTEIGVAWYVSSLFWSFIIIYIINKIFDNKAKYVFALISIFFYTILFNKGNPFDEPMLFYGIMPFFLMRGIAGLSIGYCIFYFQSEINIHKVIAVIIEIVLTVIIVILTSVKNFYCNYPMIVISFIGLLYLNASNKIYSNNYLNLPIFSSLSKFSYTIFILQENIFRLFNKFVYCKNSGEEYSFVLWILCPFFICIILGVFVYYLLEHPIQKLIKKNLGL